MLKATFSKSEPKKMVYRDFRSNSIQIQIQTIAVKTIAVTNKQQRLSEVITNHMFQKK